MLFNIFQNTFLSIIFIVVVHSIYKFFKNNLTIPKTKDLVNKPSVQYEKIKNELNTFKNDDKIKKKNENEMKTELQNYLKELSDSKKNNEPISGGFDNNFSSSFKPI